MSKALQRLACLAILSFLTAAFISACSSQGGVNERRRLARSREAAALDEVDELVLDEAEPGDTVAAADDEGLDELGVSEAVDTGDDLMVAGDDDDIVDSPPAIGRAADVLRDMRVDEQRDVEESKWWARKGDESFDRKEYEAARDAYRKALDLDPGNAQARQRYHQARSLLGDRRGSVEILRDQHTNEIRVRRDQVGKEVRGHLQEAEIRFERGDYEQAEHLAKTAVDMISLNPDMISADLKADGEALLGKIRRRKAELQEAERRELVQRAEEESREEREEQARNRHEQVQDLLRKARRHIRREEYYKAIEACESVLVLDQTNKVASFWLRRSKEQLKRIRLARVHEERLVNERMLDEGFIQASTPYEDIVFPDAEEWERVRGRAARLHQVNLQEPEPIRKLKAQLDSQVIQNVNFDDTSLQEVIDTFKELAGVNILIDSGVDAEEIKITQPINNLTALRALRGILESNNLAYTFRENIMFITSKDDVQVDTVFDVYNVSDLVMKIRDFSAPEIRLRGANEQQGESTISIEGGGEEEGGTFDPDLLVEMIQDTTGGENSWVDGTSIEFTRGQLFVDAPRELHVKVQEVLMSLRQDSDLFVVIEARFIDINDDFLEDIGIDARNLGQVNNLGTPFGNVINNNSTGGNDLGIVQQGSLDDVDLVMGTDRWAGRVQHIIDGFAGTISGDRLNAGSIGGGTFQATWLEPFQVNVILRMVQENSDVRQLTAPVVTAHNNERVYVSVITQRAYIADYELVSGGTGFAIIEVADPVVQTFQEGVILDVDPTISHDKKYVTLDVRPTLATLIGGIISTINISLGSFTNVAFQVPIGIPQISLQQSFTSVTVPNGGTVLLGGFKSMDESKYTSYLPVLGKIPILKNLARRKATIREKRSLVILLNARIVDLRGREERMFNIE